MFPVETALSDRAAAWYDRVYERYRVWAAVPVLIFVAAVAVLAGSYVTTGQVVTKGIDFTGGTALQFQVTGPVDTANVEQAFDERVTVRTMSQEGGKRWVVVETQRAFDGASTEQLQTSVKDRLDAAGVPYTGDISVQSLGAAVGEAFFREAQMWAGVALILMSAVIFIAFRSVVPSLAVIFAALTDILVALAGMSLLGIDLTLGSLAALLMLLGYSVDTDILLSTRVLRQQREPLKDRVKQSILTGSTMTLAAVVAFAVLYLVSAAPQLDQIAAVIVIGLLADLPITWLGNTAILRWYVEGQ